MSGERYTEGELDLLRELALASRNYDEVADKFYEVTGKCKKPGTLKAVCNRWDIRLSEHNGHFKKGRRNPDHQRLPIGAEVMRPNRQNHIYVKVSDNPVPMLDNSTERNNLRWANYRRKCELVYEETYGAIPEGGMIIFLDGDKYNFSPENLYCINRKIHARMCKNQWYSTEPMLTLTAIRWCEHYYALKEFCKEGI